MLMPTFDCPACGHPADASPNNVGRRTQCSECGHLFTVPSVGTYIPPSGPVAEPEDLDSEDSRDDYDPSPRPSRSRRNPTQRTDPLLLAFFVALAIHFVSLVIVISIMGRSIDGFLLFVVTMSLSWLVAIVCFCAWMIRDARARGAQSPEIWIVVLLIGWVIGIAVYLLSRPPGRLSPCSRCGELQLPRLRRCPHCGD